MRKYHSMLSVTAVCASLVCALVLGTACGEGDDPEPSNSGSENSTSTDDGKGDIPTGEAADLCSARQSDLVDSTRPAFLDDAIRWPCADVEGVTTANRDDRGQEYCEYFAVIQQPDELGEGWEEKGLTLGRPDLSDPELQSCRGNSDCGEGEACIALGGDQAPQLGCGRGCAACAPLTADFNEEQQFFLEDQGAEVVGKCVFSSWHSDVPGPLPCGEECGDIYGHELVQPNFRMINSINSNWAASDLVRNCVQNAAGGDYPQGDLDDPDDPRHEPFFRGCLSVEDIFQTHWRFSDPSVCTVAMRAVECGCTVGGDPNADLGFALVPSVDQQQQNSGGVTLRGFPLGTWSAPDRLPNGCRYVAGGEEVDGAPSQTLVECDIRGSELLEHIGDPKDFCRKKYGSDVVVHVPIPKTALECEPGDNQYADTCTENPWVIVSDGRQGASAE